MLSSFFSNFKFLLKLEYCNGVHSIVFYWFWFSGTGASRHTAASASTSGGSSQTQQWLWREEFKSHLSKISICLNEVMRQVFEKALDDELQSYKTWKKIPVIKIKGWQWILINPAILLLVCYLCTYVNQWYCPDSTLVTRQQIMEQPKKKHSHLLEFSSNSHKIKSFFTGQIF